MKRQFFLLLGLACALTLHAHDFRVGDLRIDHPYATPTLPGLKTGAVYFRAIENRGRAGDRLLSARTPVAAQVQIHRMQLQAEIMRMRAVPALDLPPASSLQLRHGSRQGQHLMLFDLTAPLKEGERFPLTLVFERAGVLEVMVSVQTPRVKDAGHDGH
jgi:copper(I)-binding protein